MTVDELTAGQKLDALVAGKVMGWTGYRYEREGSEHTEWIEVNGRGKRVYCDWHPSTDIAAAWQVVERILAIEKAKKTDLPVFVVDASPSGGSAMIQIGMGCRVVTENAETVPLAICRAALKAVERNLEAG